LEVQRSVVIEEFKQRYLNQPYGDVWLLLRPLAYQVHPYKWATIGKEISHIENATMEDVKSFFKTHYNPSNAIMVVAGHVDPERVRELAEKWFGPIPSGEKPQRNLPKEPALKENKKMEIEAEVPSNRIYKAFHVVGRYDKDFHPIDLMSDLLGRGESSYLYEYLVHNERIFDNLQSYLMGSSDPGLLVIQGQVTEGVDIAMADKALEDLLKKFVKDGITEEGLQKVKNQAESSLVFSEVEVLNRAMNLAMAANAGNVEYVNQETDKIQAVRKSDLEFWAEKLFLRDSSCTLWYKKIVK
ncbi:MAG: M16 family metallopeptidase, partial [Aquirufa sp.]